MGPEFWVGLAAVFVSGGAVGAAGTLLSQWLIRKLGSDEAAELTSPPISSQRLHKLRRYCTAHAANRASTRRRRPMLNGG